MRILSTLLLPFVLMLSIETSAQTCTTLGQNPSSAFPVCGTTTFTQTNVPSCGGRQIPGPCGIGLNDVNPFYYKFTCFTAGSLGFVIRPFSPADDYDWQLFDITGRNPNDIYTDASLFVACNWSGQLGSTGAVPSGSGLVHCAGGVPINSAMPNIQVGHEYLLLVSNFSNSQQGYNLDFTGGTASITDPLQPNITSAVPNCDGTKITVHFNKKLRCNSLAGNGSDFRLNPGGFFIAATSANCAGGFDMDSAVLTLPNPLPSGNYTLEVVNGFDGTTLYDVCGSLVPIGSTVPFTMNTLPQLVMGTVTQPGCEPTSLTLNFPEPISCNSISSNGSEFTIIGPSQVVVTGATGVACTNGETTSITLQLASPIIIPGNYQIQMNTGSDNNTILGSCNRFVFNNTTTPFNLATQAALPMGTVQQPACLPTFIDLELPNPIYCTTIAANGSDFQLSGPLSVSIVSALPNNCDGNGRTTSVRVTFSSPLLSTGNYTLSVINGSDGNTLVGNCGSMIAPNSIAPFNLPPQPTLTMGTIQPPPCTPTSIVFDLMDPIFCSSIAANGSDFQITGPGAVTISSAAAVSCDPNGQTRSIRVNFSAPIIVTGNYTLTIANGSDGNSLVGDCGRIVPVASNTAFALAAQPPLAMGTIQPPLCLPTYIDFDLTDPIFCNTVAANGSDFQITGPSTVAVASAVPVNCDANGQTRAIRINFSAPILATGNYTLNVVNGSDANTLIGDCGRIIPVASNATFNLAPQPAIAMGTVPVQPCSPSSFTITFADSILCSTIAPNGSDFAVTGPAAVTVTSAIPTVCSPNGRTMGIVITLSGPISVDGNYTITVNTGSDGNTLIGNCNRIVTHGSNVALVIPPAPAAALTNITKADCSPSTIQLNFDSPVRCNSISPNGSDFIITGPSAVSITGATGACDANGLTSTITLQLASSIVVGGNYQVQLVQGSDGNTLLNDCFRATQTFTSPFTAVDTVSAEFDYTIQYDCDTDEITFTHDGAHGVNNWAWMVNSSTAGTGSSFSQVFPATSNNIVELTVSNGSCTDTYSTTIVLDNQVIVDFEVPDNICPGDTAIFINNTTGLVDTWSWTFGNGNTSGAEQPMGQVYPVTGIESQYNVTLTANNSFGCSVSETKILTVLATCLIAVPSAFTPNNDGLNDFLFPLNALKAENLDFKVFNRWGELVFHSKNWLQKWDGRVKGKEQATGVYVWSLSYIDRDTRVKHSVKGTTVLIR